MSLQEQLITLAELDSHLRGLRSRVDAGQRRQNALSGKLEQLQIEHDELSEQHKHAQALAATQESESSGIDTKIEKLRTQMNTVTTNKEYQALLVEVNTIKLERGKLEEQALMQMQLVEEMSGRLDDLKTQIEDQQKMLSAAKKEVADALAEVKDRLDEVQAQRDKAAADVPEDVMKVYMHNLDSTGEPLGVVEEADRKRLEYICGGCYMQIPIERINTLLTRRDEMVTCSSCGRILVIDETLRDALQPA